MKSIQISVVVCSVQEPTWTVHERNIASTIGVEFEYIRIDNRGNPYSLAAAYQLGLEQCQGEVVVFVHEDVFFLESNWGQQLLSKFANPLYGALGVAGSQVLLPEFPAWFRAGRPWIKGRVLHQNPQDHSLKLCHYSEVFDSEDSEVLVLDGLCICVRRELALQVGWDSQTFDGFHMYDMDFCTRLSQIAKLFVTQDLLLVHQSGGQFNQIWWKYAELFSLKNLQLLPLVLENCHWQGKIGSPFDTEDLTQRLPKLNIQ